MNVDFLLERYGGFTKHHDPTLWKLMQMSRMGLDEDTHRTLFWAVYGNKPVDDPIWYKVLKKLPTAEALPNHGKQHSAEPSRPPSRSDQSAELPNEKTGLGAHTHRGQL